MSTMQGAVILVNEQDEVQGTMEKMRAHQEGVLHRAFSVFLFNERGELLLHQRAATKYHSPGAWTNTCCSHPIPGESTVDAAHRRLREELGMDCPLEHAFSFLYRADVGNGLTEHELDHVFLGRYDGPLSPEPDEIAAVRWISPEELSKELDQDPLRFTPWLAICWHRVLAHSRKAMLTLG